MLNALYIKQIKNIMKYKLYTNASKNNRWLEVVISKWFYDPSHGLQFSQFGWMLLYSVWVVFNNFLRIYATDSSKISSDQKSLFFAVCLFPLSFFANTPCKDCKCMLREKNHGINGTVNVISKDSPFIERHVRMFDSQR